MMMNEHERALSYSPSVPVVSHKDARLFLENWRKTFGYAWSAGVSMFQPGRGLHQHGVLLPDLSRVRERARFLDSSTTCFRMNCSSECWTRELPA